MKTNVTIESVVSCRSVIDKLVNTLLPTRTNKGKEKETTIDPQLLPLFDKAREATLRIYAELPARLRRASKYDDNFFEAARYYLELHDEYERRGILHKLEVLTARFDITGTVDLLNLNIDIDVLVAYVFRETLLRDTPEYNCEDEVIFECNICSEPDAPALFETPDIDFHELRNEYSYHKSSSGEDYWICHSTCWLHTLYSGYRITIAQQRLTMKEMWDEITITIQRGHKLCDEDGDPLTRQEMAQRIMGSKL